MKTSLVQEGRVPFALMQPVQSKDTSLKLPSKPQRAFRPTHGSDAEMTAAAAADDARALDSDVLLAHQRRLAGLGLPGTPAVLALLPTTLPCTPPATSTRRRLRPLCHW